MDSHMRSSLENSLRRGQRLRPQSRNVLLRESSRDTKRRPRGGIKPWIPHNCGGNNPIPYPGRRSPRRPKLYGPPLGSSWMTTPIPGGRPHTGPPYPDGHTRRTVVSSYPPHNFFWSTWPMTESWFTNRRYMNSVWTPARAKRVRMKVRSPSSVKGRSGLRTLRT